MTVTDFDREYVITRTLRRLGYGMVSVPIPRDTANDALDEVLLVYSRYRPRLLQREFTLESGMVSYEPPVWGRGIVKVSLRPRDADINPGSYFDTDPFYLVGQLELYPAPPGTLAGREAQNQHLGMAAKMLSNEFDWEFLRPDQSTTGRPLLLFSPWYQDSTKATYTYAEAHTEPDTVPESDRDIILLGTLAKFKEVIGGVAAKYPNGIPTPDGPIALAGDRWLSEAMAEWERFEAKLSERRTVQQMLPW